jgi:hypothetical protein
MMLIFVVIGLLLGFARGGNLSHTEKELPEGIILPVLAFVAEFLAVRSLFFPEWVQLNLVYFLLFWFVFRNRDRGAWPLWFGFGTLLNYIVIAANGYRMPVLPSLMAGLPDHVVDSLINGEIFGYMLADSGTRLVFLGDVIAVPFLGEFVGFASVGDFFLGIGVGLLAYRLTRPRLVGKL